MRRTVAPLRRLLPWITVAVLGACGDAPPEDAVAPEAEVPPPWRDDGRAVALVTDAASSHDFAWTELLEAVFGRVDVLDARRPAQWKASLADRSLILLGHDTLRRVRPGELPALEDFLARGGTLVLEAPDSAWAPGAGIRLATAERRALLPWPTPRDAGALFGDGPGSGRTSVEKAPVRGAHGLPPAAVAVPVSVWRYAPSRGVGEPARPLVRAAGRPAVWSRSVGSGTIVSLSYGLARLAVELERGDPLLPAPGFPIRDAWLSRLLESDVGSEAWPRWSNAPAGVDGWLVTTPETGATAPLGFPRGTALPRPALDPAGRPKGEHALASTGEARDASALRRHLAANAAVLAGPVPVSLAGEGGLDAAAVANAARHVVAPPEEVSAWWDARAAARLSWSDTGTWTARVRTPDTPGATRGFALLLPMRWRDEVLVGWSATWDPAPSRRVLRGGRIWLEIGVPAGTDGRLRSTYRSPRDG